MTYTEQHLEILERKSILLKNGRQNKESKERPTKKRNAEIFAGKEKRCEDEVYIYDLMMEMDVPTQNIKF